MIPVGGYYRPATKPPYSKMVVDDLDRVWLQRYGGDDGFGPTPSTEWWVFGSDGEWLAEAEMPVGLEVVDIQGNRVFGRTVDEFDVPSFSVHTIN